MLVQHQERSQTPAVTESNMGLARHFEGGGCLHETHIATVVVCLCEDKFLSKPTLSLPIPHNHDDPSNNS